MRTVCPKCGVVVALQENGSMFPHQRYVDGGGRDVGQDHTMVRCEGSEKRPGEVQS